MRPEEATEQAYKNGYEKGKQDAVKHGRWLDGKINYITLSRGNYICSNCRSASGVVKSNYCPNCGARMTGDENEQKK